MSSQLEGELSRLGLLPRAIGDEGHSLQERWGVYRHKLRALGENGGDRRVATHVLEPLDRLPALVLEDLERFPGAGRVDTRRRIAAEIRPKAVVRALSDLIAEGVVSASGGKRWRTYRLAVRHGHEP